MIKTISYNCQSFNRNTELIEIISRKCNILLLQETLIPDHALNDLDIFEDFDFAATPSTRDETNFNGRSKGGLLIAWKKELSPYITPFFYSDRIMGIYLENDNERLLLLNVYLPCDYRNQESLIEFRSVMTKLSAIVESEKQSSTDSVIIAGDFNGDPFKGRFYKEVKLFANEYSFFMSDVELLPDSSHTYVSCNSSCSTSWIDHFLSSNNQIVSSCEILYGVTFNDHIPILFDFRFELSCPNILRVTEPTHSSIPWNTLSEDLLESYRVRLDDICSAKCFSILNCDTNFCNDADHYLELDSCYDFLINALLSASDFISQRNNTNMHKKHVPGWNEYCQHLYSLSRRNYIEWISHGKPRNGDIFEDMKAARKRFKCALDFCKENELKIKRDRLAKSFIKNNKTNFWKEVKKLNKNTKKDITSIDGRSDMEEIIDVFNKKYRKVLDNPASQMVPENYENKILELNARTQIGRCMIFKHTVDDAIDNLRPALGWDSVHSNHLKFAGDSFRNLLCKVFSSFIRHSYSPRTFLRGEIRPILKSSLGNKNDSSNYRPIMNSSNLLKSFEYCLQPYLAKYLKIDGRQFAYKKNVGCTTAASLLKETIHKYNGEKSNVHSCLVDFTGAFDGINHKLLTIKLMETNLPPMIIAMLKQMNENSFIGLNINGKQKSKNDWKAGNGVRQGGVNSGILFTYYINEIISTIVECNVGCSLGGYKLNILAYADDIVLIAPTAEGLQVLMNKLGTLVKEHSLKINKNKTLHIVFRFMKKNDNYDFSLFHNNEKIEYVTSCKYLGMIFDEHLSFKFDVDRCLVTFLKQFNSMYYKFSFVDKVQLLFLFNSYCTSFYGSELWYDLLNSASCLKGISISYHSSVKKILKISKYYNNHFACNSTDMLMFKHLVYSRSVSFLFGLCFNDNNDCLFYVRDYFKYDSKFCSIIKKYSKEKYSLTDIFDNCLPAIKARIKFIQLNEESSGYVPEMRR